MPPSSSTSSSSEYARFAWKVLLLFALLFALDRVGGALAEHFFMATRDGDTGGQINGLLAEKTDVLVFGSSRAESHYVPGVLTETLGKPTFNAGFKGSNVLYDYGVEQLVFDTYAPKLIVYDFSPIAVLKPKGDPYEKLYPLYPFWKNQHVWNLIGEDGPLRKSFFLSRLYPYNSKVHSIAIFNVIKSRPGAASGYVAQGGTLGANAQPGDIDAEAESTYDPGLVDHMLKFIDSARAHGVELVVITSPRYAKGQYTIPESVRRKLAELQVPHLDFDLDEYPQFNDPRLFKDENHLNHDGAKLFSRLLGQKLNSLGQSWTAEATAQSSRQ